MSLLNLKSYINRSLVLLEENLFLKMLWLYTESTLLFLVIGLGVGSYVQFIGNVSYLKFFLIGFVFANILRIVFVDLGISFFNKIKDKNYLSQMKLLPINFEDIVRGELVLGTLKGIWSSIILILLGLLMEVYDLSKLPILLILVLISSYLFSAMSLAICLSSKTFRAITVWQFAFVIPMFFLSGVFFPLESLPSFLYYIAITFPLTNIVLISRSVMDSQFQFAVMMNAITLLIYSFLFSYIITRHLTEKIKNSE